jgi:hypothetical protein
MKKGIIPVYHPTDGSQIKDGHYLFLCNGGNFGGILEDMDIRSVVDDVCANAKPGQVPKKNLRGNCGPSLLFTFFPESTAEGEFTVCGTNHVTWLQTLCSTVLQYNKRHLYNGGPSDIARCQPISPSFSCSCQHAF